MTTPTGAADAGIPFPDILNHAPCRPGSDAELDELLELTFLGKESRRALHEGVYRGNLPPSDWDAAHFAADLFVAELVETCFRVETPRRSGPVHRDFLLRLLSHPPRDPETVALRHGVLRELIGDPAMHAKAADAHDDLRGLLDLLKAMRTDGRINTPAFRLDILTHLRAAIDRLARDFADSRSGLARLHEAAVAMQASGAYATLAALLDHEANLALVNLDVRVGADGRLRALAVRALSENSGNPFYHPPWRRWASFLRLRLRRYDLHAAELVDQLILSVYGRIAPLLRTLLQVICQLEAYLGALGFAAIAGERGLAVCLPEMAAGAAPRLDALFNPLLLRAPARPVPCTIGLGDGAAVVLVTGPNSGGKTRLLQAVGIAHLLGQCGLFVPCQKARLPLARGLFVSLVEPGGADAVEGRLGGELLRIRTLFASTPPRAVVLLDELCSGTNPSEAIEIVSMVLRLLVELRPVAFVTTHFLDFARRLAEDRLVPGLTFLQVEVDDRQLSTYQFIPGVATTSMAAGTARRLGVTFEELEDLLRRRGLDVADGPTG